MKYIITKDGNIFETNGHSYWNNYTLHSELYPEELEKFKKTIVKQANTIEELCDWIVYRPNGKIRYLLESIDNQDICFDYEILDFENWYGALDTDKGLIYVAKMKGILPNGDIDWELL